MKISRSDIFYNLMVPQGDLIPQKLSTVSSCYCSCFKAIFIEVFSATGRYASTLEINTFYAFSGLISFAVFFIIMYNYAMSKLPLIAFDFSKKPSVAGDQKLHLKPTLHEDGIGAPEIVRLIKAMGLEPENVHFRFISKNRVAHTLSNGTDRDSGSTNHNDQYGSGTPYESAAMAEHGVYDPSYTSYLSDGKNLTRPDAGYSLNLRHGAVILFKKDDDIVSINPFKYLKSGERPDSFGFHIFKRHPSTFLVEAISENGNEVALPPSGRLVSKPSGTEGPA